MQFFINIFTLAILLVNGILAQQQYYTATGNPSHTATLGQAYQQHPTLRTFSGAAPQASYGQLAQTNLAQYAQVAPAPAQYAQSPALSQYVQATPAQYSPRQAPNAAPVLATAAPAAQVSYAPSSYGWQVQHQHQAPQQAPVPTAQAPVSPSYAQAPVLTRYAQTPALTQYAQTAPAPASAQYAQAAPVQAQFAPAVQSQQYTNPQPAAPAPANVAQVSALHRPAAIHYASIGENLAGDYKFGYQTGDGNSFREEARLPDGTVQGQYGFVDADGKQRVVKYTAGINGFQVLNGDNPASAAPTARAAAPNTQPVPVPQWAQSHLGATVPAAAPAQPTQFAPAAAASQPQHGTSAWGSHLG